MAFSTEFDMPSYIIYRDTQPGQPFDPTAQLVFFPPKNSDELFDALRAKYPWIKSHSERVAEAVIEYLLQEPQPEQVAIPTPVTANSTNVSPWEASMQSTSSDISTWSSPETLGLATPTFGNSPQAQPLTRQFSTATSGTAPSEASPPALEQMTGVFSLSSSTQPKQRVRRKMTESEKAEYRQRRIVKACDKCAKRKRKCTHSQEEVQIATTQLPKTAKSVANSKSKKAQTSDLPKIHQANDLFMTNGIEYAGTFGTAQTQPFDEFNDFLEEPLPEVNFDELLATTPMPWAWSATADWTLMDSLEDPYGNQSRQGRPLQHVGPSGEPESTPGIWDSEMMETVANSNTHGNRANAAQEDMRTEQQRQKPQPTHTAHVHDSEAAGLFTSDRTTIQNAAARTGDNWRQQSNSDVASGQLSQQAALGVQLLSTLAVRTTATAKAIRAFGSLLGDHHRLRSTLTSISVRTVAPLVQDSLLLENLDPSFKAQEQSLRRTSHGKTELSSISQGQEDTIGGSATARVNPSTQLYMLKRRIPRALHSIVDRNNSGDMSGLTPLLRLTTPLWTHDQQDDGHDMSTTRNTQDNALRAGDAQSSSSSDYAAHLQTENYGERLSDHVRYRDHFGRLPHSALLSLSAIAGLACLLMLLSFLPPQTTNLSLLLLALASPVHGAKGSPVSRNRAFILQLWGSSLQRLEEDFAWLIQSSNREAERLSSWNDLPEPKSRTCIWQAFASPYRKWRRALHVGV